MGMHNDPTDEDFIEKYDRYISDAVPFFSGSTERELREVISHLIRRRQASHQEQIETLEAKARRLAAELKHAEREKLLAEIACFRDILRLHKQLDEDEKL